MICTVQVGALLVRGEEWSHLHMKALSGQKTNLRLLQKWVKQRALEMITEGEQKNWCSWSCFQESEQGSTNDASGKFTGDFLTKGVIVSMNLFR